MVKQPWDIDFSSIYSESELSQLHERTAWIGAPILPPISEEVLESIRINQEWIQKLAPIAEEFMSAQKELNAIMEQLQPALTEFQCAFNEIDQLLAGVSIPSVSKEEKENLLKSHRQWGEYGWTLHPNAILKFFYHKPIDRTDAYNRMRIFLSEDNTNCVFRSLQRDLPQSKDLGSAIFCFQNKEYKACSLLIFSMLDSMLIGKQPETKWRHPGKGGVDYFKEQTKPSDEQFMLFVLQWANVIACLETVFASGNNFTNEPETINRNFISHGMSKRSVSETDCQQLFMLLHNFIWFLNRWFPAE